MNLCARNFILSALLLMGLSVSAALAGSNVRSDSIESPLPDPSELPHRIPRVEDQIQVDGLLDDPVWSNCLILELNYEVQPAENVEPPVRTEVLLAYGPSDLYVAFRAHDPEPDQIRARISNRDDIWSDDWVAINLDTFNDARRSFILLCNPFGVQADNIEQTAGNSAEWDAIWDSAGLIHDWGYAVEMVIPFSSLRFQRSETDQIWGIDAIRSYPRSVRHHIGLFPRDRSNNCYLCQAEKVVGFAGADPGHNLEIAPTVTGFYSQDRPEGDNYGPFVESRPDLDAGLTARWGVTPNLTFTGAYNPDFSQVEADAAQLDVNTRFALFYDERRPFFLEGADLFDVRNHIYTRTVADPIWGAKLTGKEGGNGIGAFVARDELTNLIIPSADGSETETLDEESSVGVLRYTRDFGASSYLGALLTDREAGEYKNRVGGLDTRLDLSKAFRMRFQATGTMTEYPDSLAEAFGQDRSMKGELMFANLSHNANTNSSWVWGERINPDFRADAGFITRTDYTTGGFGHSRNWTNTDPNGWWSRFFAGGEFEEAWSYDGSRPVVSELDGWINYNGPMQTWIEVYGEISREWYLGERYPGDSMWIGGGFRPTRDIYLEGGFGYGKEIDYENNRPGVGLSANQYFEVNLGRHLQVDIGHQYEHLDVEPGRLFVAHITRTRAAYQFTRRMFVRVIVQHIHYDFNQPLYEDAQDDIFQRFASQLLFSYTINPQTVLYLGYSDAILGYDRQPLSQINRTLFFKIGYAWVP